MARGLDRLGGYRPPDTPGLTSAKGRILYALVTIAGAAPSGFLMAGTLPPGRGRVRRRSVVY